MYLYYAMKFKFEIMLSLVFIMYVINLFLGKKANFKIAHAFHNKVLDTIADNFHQIGFGSQPNHLLN